MPLITSFINKRAELEWKFDTYNCQHHKETKEACKIYVDKLSYVDTIIHDCNYNYMVKNYFAYCTKRKSLTNKLLNYCTKLTSSTKGNNFITIKNDNIYKIKHTYITHQFLLYVNELTINTDIKMWGMIYY